MQTPPGAATFKPHRYVDAIPENVALFYDDVTNIDADTKCNPTVFRNVNRAVGHLALNFSCAAHGIDGACKLNQRSIARVFDDAAPVRGDLGINEGLAQGFQRRERSFLVDAH
jgi:hypothetical protein